MKVFSLICACCGAAVEVEESANLYKCSYCGAQQVVEHSGDVISLKKIETLLDDVKVGANRAASGLALQRLLNDIAIIEKSRDQELAQLKAADDQNNSAVGWFFIIGVTASIIMFGWWSIPVIGAGVALTWKWIPSVAQKIRSTESKAIAKIAPLKEQIARHQVIVDAYDMGAKSSD